MSEYARSLLICVPHQKNLFIIKLIMAVNFLSWKTPFIRERYWWIDEHKCCKFYSEGHNLRYKTASGIQEVEKYRGHV